MLWPGRSASEFSTAPAPVMMPQPSGPTMSSGAESGTFTTLRSRARAYVAKDDCAKKFARTGVSPRRARVEPSARTPLKFRASCSMQ